MCTVLPPPGDNTIAVNKYINIECVSAALVTQHAPGMRRIILQSVARPA